MPGVPSGERSMSALDRYEAAESLTLEQAMVLLKEMADELREIRDWRQKFNETIQKGLVEFFRERNERLDREAKRRWWRWEK
jgi:hypothetical protein